MHEKTMQCVTYILHDRPYHFSSIMKNRRT